MWGIIFSIYASIAGLCMFVGFILVLIKAPKNLLFGDTYSGIFKWSLFWVILLPTAIWGYIFERNFKKKRDTIAYNLFLDKAFYDQTQMIFDYNAIRQTHPEITSIKEYYTLLSSVCPNELSRDLMTARSGEEIYNVLTKHNIGKEHKPKVLDRNKKSNMQCLFCKHFAFDNDICTLDNSIQRYWNRCNKFEWKELDGRYWKLKQ